MPTLTTDKIIAKLNSYFTDNQIDLKIIILSNLIMYRSLLIALLIQISINNTMTIVHLQFGMI